MNLFASALNTISKPVAYTMSIMKQTGIHVVARNVQCLGFSSLIAMHFIQAFHYDNVYVDRIISILNITVVLTLILTMPYMVIPRTTSTHIGINDIHNVASAIGYYFTNIIIYLFISRGGD